VDSTFGKVGKHMPEGLRKVYGEKDLESRNFGCELNFCFAPWENYVPSSDFSSVVPWSITMHLAYIVVCILLLIIIIIN